MNTALTPPRNACRFGNGFVKVVAAGRHEIFREPTVEERAELASGRFEECERHAQQRRAQEAKRKRLAAKKKHKRIKLAKAAQ